VPGRHVKPRHRGPGFVERSVAQAASGVSTAMTASGRALVLFGVAGSATAFGLVAAQAADSASTSAAPAHHRNDAAISATHHRTSASVTAALASRAAHPEVRVSRSSGRPPTVKEQRIAKAKALPVRQALRRGVTRTIAPATPREAAMSMLANFGWSSDQFSCLDELWNSESGWNPYATNSTSGAYGIPQALPAEKMASAGADWRTNPVTQIEWGLDYIRQSYGTPCSAWAFKLGNSWY
jgi:hypothetical protein